MAIDLTQAARNAANALVIQPQLVLEIEGVPTIYGARRILRTVKIGDPGLLIGDDWIIGGSVEVGDQNDFISLEGTSTTINQQLNPDKGAVTSVASIQVALIDKEDLITELISPGFVVDDLLMRRCKLWMGFANTSYPEDYFIVFRGVIDDIISEQGQVLLTIAHPDQKKRQDIFQKATTETSGTHNSAVTTINCDDTTNFLAPVNGPSGAQDTSISYYIRIDDEVIKYTGKTGTTFTGCTRGALGTTAAAHDADSNIDSFYRLTGNCIDLALKLMLSGWNDYFAEDVEVTSFNRISSTESVDNAIYFNGINVEQEYGLSIGDYITTTGASNGANNVTLKTISSIVVDGISSYIVVDGVTFIYEDESDAVISFRSQYDTLGEGLKMYPDEVDVAQHLVLYRLFLSSLSYDFYLKDTVKGKDFINEEIYLPGAMYAIPRKSKSSVQYHIGPIPGSNPTTLNETNVINPSKIKIRRTITKNFYNTIVYKFDDDVLEDKFLTGYILTDATSKAQIPAGNKVLTIESKGMRTSLLAVSQAATQSARRLNRYKFAAEFFDDVEVLFSEGYALEIGDILLFDGSNLNISDIKSGARGMTVRFFEVVNKKFDLRKGKIALTLVDTGFSTANRYALIAPASNIKSAVSASQFVIEPGVYSDSTFGSNEGQKWSRYPDAQIRVRNETGSINGESDVNSVSGNTIVVSPALGFTPANGQIFEISLYPEQIEQIKLLYGHMTDDSEFDDGKAQYKML